MRTALVLLLAGLILAAGAHGNEDEGVSFGYDGATGPARWGELDPEWAACGEGRRQSPVDIAAATSGDVAPLRFDYTESEVEVTDTGHTVTFAPAARNALRVGGRAAGTIAQLHFHAASEHRVDGRSYPLELHLVHADDDGRLTVVGVFVKRGAPNAALAELSRGLPEGEGATATGSLDPAGILPASRRSVRYSGSLTTPPCTEGVRWIVLRTPITMSRAQIQRFRDRYAHNRRPLQRLNGRSLLAG